MSLPKVYDFSGVLEILPLSRNTLYQLLISGELRGTKSRNKWLITETAIAAYLGLDTEDPAEREPGGTVESVNEIHDGLKAISHG